MRLAPSTINKLVELLRPFMEDEQNRRPFLILALGNDAPVLQRITWSGAVAAFIPDMVCKLADYDQLEPGRQALWALLEYVRSQAGIDVQQRIDKLRLLIDLPAHSDAAIDTTSDLDVLVQKVRSRLHDDIQSLHGTMPLWGVDRWVPLGNLFVDVNILEELSSSCRSELNALWQDFSKNPSYRSLERIGLGKERKRVLGLEVLAKNTNLMVVGKPGSGKTTYLQRVVMECNGGNLQAYRIPVLIKLREFVEDGHELANSLERYLEQCWRLSNAETQLVLDRGRALVLLDGLDEVTGKDGKNIAKQIKRFARTYPQVQVIVTCRTQIQESRFERFDYVEVADFDESQVQAFVEHWFKAAMGDELAGLAKAQEFLEQLFLEKNKPIRELAITPILLSLTCAVFHQTGKFYSKRSKLYEEGLELLLEQWDKSREIERDEIYRDLLLERKIELLIYLAVKKFKQPQYVLFEQTELEGYIAEFLGIGQRDSRMVLRAIEAQHGLLIERAHRVWSFSHLTFQEYLVAKWFCEKNRWEDLINCLEHKNWREIFLMVFESLLDGNRLSKLMKIKTDKLVEDDEKIQSFLNWVNEKSKRVNLPYKKSSIRGFYFSRFRNLKLNILDFINHIEHGVDQGILGLTGPFSSLSNENKASIRIPLLIAALKTEVYILLGSDFQLFDIIENNVVSSDLINLEIDLPLQQKIQQLYDQLPNIEGQIADYEHWWEVKCKPWLEQLQNIIIEFRNVEHQWQFHPLQMETLNKYYDANKLLIECLNSGYSISHEVSEVIRETLLLPIAEIEKRKREKVE